MTCYNVFEITEKIGRYLWGVYPPGSPKGITVEALSQYADNPEGMILMLVPAGYPQAILSKIAELEVIYNNLKGE